MLLENGLGFIKVPKVMFSSSLVLGGLAAMLFDRSVTAGHNVTPAELHSDKASLTAVYPTQ